MMVQLWARCPASCWWGDRTGRLLILGTPLLSVGNLVGAKVGPSSPSLVFVLSPCGGCVRWDSHLPLTVGPGGEGVGAWLPALRSSPVAQGPVTGVQRAGPAARPPDSAACCLSQRLPASAGRGSRLPLLPSSHTLHARLCASWSLLCGPGMLGARQPPSRGIHWGPGACERRVPHLSPRLLCGGCICPEARSGSHEHCPVGCSCAHAGCRVAPGGVGAALSECLCGGQVGAWGYLHPSLRESPQPGVQGPGLQRP